MSADLIPAGFQQAPVLQAFSVLSTENAVLLEAIRQIADTDCRYGLLMKETAIEALNRVLEDRAEARAEARAKERAAKECMEAHIEAARSFA